MTFSHHTAGTSGCASSVRNEFLLAAATSCCSQIIKWGLPPIQCLRLCPFFPDCIFPNEVSWRHCTVTLTVAVLLARLGSGVSAMVAAFSVITVPAGAVTFTVRRTVHVVFGAMLPFS